MYLLGLLGEILSRNLEAVNRGIVDASDDCHQTIEILQILQVLQMKY